MPRNLKDQVSWSFIINSPIVTPCSTLLNTNLVLDGGPIIVSRVAPSYVALICPVPSKSGTMMVVPGGRAILERELFHISEYAEVKWHVMKIE